jgi:hypothetical protein
MSSQSPSPPRSVVLKGLREMPNVGPRTAEDLWRLGVRSAADLKGADPEELYERLCRLKRVRIDPCQLYVFRSLVYYSRTGRPKPELLKWWNWKDRRLRKS